MRSAFTALVTAAVLCSLPVHGWVPPRLPAGDTTQVQFARGAESATLSGTLTPASAEREYVLRARAGQVLDLSVVASPEVIAQVIAPGREAWMMTHHASSTWSRRLLTTGEYRIRLSYPRHDSEPYQLAVGVHDAPEPRAFADGSYSDGSNSMSIRRAPGGRIRVELSLLWQGLGDNVHIGELSTVLTPRGNVAVYREGACTITFHLDQDRVYVSQAGMDAECGFGANVYADGEYLFSSSR